MAMKKWLVFFLGIIMGCIACNPDKKTGVDMENIRFTTSDASELFFKNVRKPYYDVEINKEAKIEVYRLNKILKQKVMMVPTIVYNWRDDQAFILLESENSFDEITLLGASKAVTTSLLNKDEHYRFASEIYNQIINENEPELVIEEDTAALFQNNEQRNAFRITMLDFYRLVGIYQ